MTEPREGIWDDGHAPVEPIFREEGLTLEEEAYVLRRAFEDQVEDSAPECRQRRPEGHKRCIRPKGHEGAHMDRLGQAW